MAGIHRVYQQIKDRVPVPQLAEGSLTTREVSEMIGLFEVIELERRYTGDLTPTPAAMR
jgi:hypothetical protein